MQKSIEKAVLAGGCFWCLEPLFDRIDGIISVRSGYAGGSIPHPSYEQVCSGSTGHLEAVEIVFDPLRLSYSQLLDVFWHHIDPTDPFGQFCDKGEQYLSAIFYVDQTQKNIAEQSKQKIAQQLKGKQIYTQIRPLDVFYPAEEYHQEFYQKNPGRYQSYRSCCGRDQRLKELWG